MTLVYDAGYGPLIQSTVRIATWNLWGRYGPWQARLPAIIATLRSVDADIIGLQEVWCADGRSLAVELAAELGYPPPVFAQNLDFGSWASGNAVLARWPIARHEICVLPREGSGARDDEGEERLCVFAEIDGPRGPIQVFCAHLSWRGDHSGVRQEQVRAMCEFVRAQKPRSFPAVLLGDLNAAPDSDEMRMLRGAKAVPVPGVMFNDAWEWAGRGAEPGYTISNDNPFMAASLDASRRIDYIMVGAAKAGGCGQPRTVHVFGDRPLDGMLGSDHYGVITELRY